MVEAKEPFSGYHHRTILTKALNSRSSAGNATVVLKTIPRGGAVGWPSGPFEADFAQKLFVGAYGSNAALCAIATPLGLKVGRPTQASTSAFVGL